MVMPDNPPDKPSVLTKEMIDKLKDQLDAMEGKEIKSGGPVSHKPGDNTVAWYIAYGTS
jgi:hypothetical protein